MTAPSGRAPDAGLDAATIAELNELLQLDHDAVAAYTLAIGALTNVGRRETVIRYRADHERHIADLSRAIRRLGGTPAEAGGAGTLRQAMQRLGAFGGDRAVMVAFKATEALSCERYTRAVTHAGGWPAELRDLVTTAADDEARHYDWAETQLETLGAGPETAAGRVASAVETAHAGAAAAADRMERGARAVRERLPDRLPEVTLPEGAGRAVAVGAVAAGVSFLVTAAIARALRERR